MLIIHMHTWTGGTQPLVARARAPVCPSLAMPLSSSPLNPPYIYICISPMRPLSLHLPPFPHFPSHTSNCSHLAIIEVRGGTEVRIGSRQHVENQVVPPSIPAGTYVHRRESFMISIQRSAHFMIILGEMVKQGYRNENLGTRPHGMRFWEWGYMVWDSGNEATWYEILGMRPRGMRFWEWGYMVWDSGDEATSYSHEILGMKLHHIDLRWKAVQ